MDGLVDRVLGLDLDVEYRGRAVRTVAAAAHDADDCQMLLDMLGLCPHDGAGAVLQRSEPSRKETVRKSGRLDHAPG